MAPASSGDQSHSYIALPCWMNEAARSCPIILPTPRAVTVDELSDVRYLHALSVKRLTASHLSEAEVAAFSSHVYSPSYASRLGDVASAGRLLGVFIEGELVATAGWIPANDAGAVARLMAIFVSPLYAGLGLGRLIVEAAESKACQAGFNAFTVRVPVNAIDFFTSLGYQTASNGVWSLGNGVDLPVAFMRRQQPPATQIGK